MKWIVAGLGVGLAGALMLSGTLNLLLYRRAQQYYRALNQTRLDPQGLRHYPDNLARSPQADRPRVVFFGDSRAEAWPAPELQGYEFINRGIGAQTSVQVAQRFPLHVQPLQPDIIILQVGVNDLKTIALFPQSRDQIVAQCKANIQQIIEDAQAAGAVVIVTTIFPLGEVPLVRQPFWSEDIAPAIVEVNDYIATLSSDRVIVFDTSKILADSQGQVQTAYQADELHLNAQGYAVLNQALRAILTDLPGEASEN